MAILMVFSISFIHFLIESMVIFRLPYGILLLAKKKAPLRQRPVASYMEPII